MDYVSSMLDASLALGGLMAMLGGIMWGLMGEDAPERPPSPVPGGPLGPILSPAKVVA